MNPAWLLSVLLVAPLAAQHLQREAAHAVARNSPGVTWSNGKARVEAFDYVAEFDGLGLRFTPALGPQAQPVTWRLAFASAGRERGAVGSAPVAPQREPGAVRYARTADLVERYRVRDDGVELTFTFDRPLPGRGDLLVRMAVISDANCPSTPPQRGALSWKREGRGVRVGEVLGIDARGQRMPGTLAFDGTHLELRLPAAFVDGAAYPLVLDPLIGTEAGVATGSSNERHADVAYDPGSDRYLVVWERSLSVSGTSVMGRLLDGQGAPIGSIFAIYSSFFDHGTRPVVANILSSGRFVVGWIYKTGLLEQGGVRVCAVDADGTVWETVPVSSQRVNAIDIGGNSTASGTDAVVVWVEERVIDSCRLHVPSSGAGLTAGSTKNVGGGPANAFWPDVAISKTGGSVNRFVVAYGGYRNQSVQAALAYAHAVDPDGQTLGPPVVLADESVLVEFGGIDVDGNGSEFMAAFVKGSAVRARGLRWNGTALEATTGDVAVEQSSPPSLYGVSIGRMGQKYLASWSVDKSLLAGDIEGIELDPTTCLPCGEHFAIVRPDRHEHRPKIATQASAGGAGEEGMMVFASGARAFPYDNDIFAQRFEQFGSGGSQQNLGGGCGGSYALGTDSPVAIGNRGLRFTVDGVAGASSVYLFVGVGKPAIPCGSCAITDPVISPLGKLDGDRATRPFPIPCMPSLIGGTLEFQWAVFGAPGAPCFILPGLGFSDRYAVTIGT